MSVTLSKKTIMEYAKAQFTWLNITSCILQYYNYSSPNISTFLCCLVLSFCLFVCLFDLAVSNKIYEQWSFLHIACFVSIILKNTLKQTRSLRCNSCVLAAFSGSGLACCMRICFNLSQALWKPCRSWKQVNDRNDWLFDWLVAWLID